MPPLYGLLLELDVLPATVELEELDDVLPACVELDELDELDSELDELDDELDELDDIVLSELDELDELEVLPATVLLLDELFELDELELEALELSAAMPPISRQTAPAAVCVRQT